MNLIEYDVDSKKLYNIYQCIYCSEYHPNVTNYCNKHRKCNDKNSNCCSTYVLDELLSNKHDEHDFIPCNNICNIRCWINKYITKPCESHSCLNCNESVKKVNFINSFIAILKEYGSYSNKNNYISLSKYLFCDDKCYNEYTSTFTKIIEYNSICLDEKMINQHKNCIILCDKKCKMIKYINKKNNMNENIIHCLSCTNKLSTKNSSINNIMLVYLNTNDGRRSQRYNILKKHMFCNQKCFSEYFIN